MNNITQIARLFLIVFLILIISCSGFNNSLTNSSMDWNLLKLPRLNKKWDIVNKTKDNDKITFECVYCEGAVKPSIYIEYSKTLTTEPLPIEDIFKELRENFELINDNISTDTIKINNVLGYRIFHSIIKDKRKMQTVLIKKDTDIFIFSFFAPMDDYENIKFEFENFINNVKW